MARIRNRKRNTIQNNNNNSYEEARKQRLQDNLKRFQDLGILKISTSLSEFTKSDNKLELHHVKPKSKTSLENQELRRSSRARGPIPSYQEVAIDFREYRRSYARRSSGVKASDEERWHAMMNAEELQSNLGSGHPSFVKSMVRSHVSSCFWLGLPTKFCKDHLPTSELKMVLEDQSGSEYNVIYIGSRTGLSGGWKGFAVDHGLDDGDALVFELSEPARFKVYIVKASVFSNQDNKEKIVNTQEKCTGKAVKVHKLVENENDSVSQKLKHESGSMERAKSFKRK